MSPGTLRRGIAIYCIKTVARILFVRRAGIILLLKVLDVGESGVYITYYSFADIYIARYTGEMINDGAYIHILRHSLLGNKYIGILQVARAGGWACVAKH